MVVLGVGWGAGTGSTDEAVIQSSFQALDVFKRLVNDDRMERRGITLSHRVRSLARDKARLFNRIR